MYRTGIYARLSSEDREEDTLENQIYLLKSHVEGQTDMILTDTYVDNGFSGTNFQRPQFIRMMEDVRCKEWKNQLYRCKGFIKIWQELY